MKVLAALAVVLALFLGWRKWVDMQRVKTLNAIASEIAGRRVTVHCPGFFSSLLDIHGESGSVSFDENGRISDHTDLPKAVCDRLEHFGNSDLSCVENSQACGRGAEQTVDAALTLTHESFHLKGETDEAVTQCYAVQTVASTARQLDAAPGLADAIARYYLTHIQPRMPSEYQLPSGAAATAASSIWHRTAPGGRLP